MSHLSVWVSSVPMSPLDPRPGSNDKYLTSSLPQALQIPTKYHIVTTYLYTDKKKIIETYNKP